MHTRGRSSEGGTCQETVANYWSSDEAAQAFSRATYWLANPLVQERYHSRATLGAHPHWVNGTIFEFIGERRPVRRLLSVGCGDGHLERHLMEAEVAEAIDAIDIAPARIERARKSAEAEGIDRIHYRVANAEEEEFPHSSYEAIYFDSSLHHIQDLETVLDRSSAALCEDGLLILHEYVGPRRFDLSARHKEIIEACFALLPERFRRNCGTGSGGEIMTRPAIPDPEEVVRVDPSESIRSDEILALVESRFEVLALRDLGGAILQFLLANIAGNFGDGDPVARSLMESFFALEDALLEEGDLPSCFVLLVAKKRA